MHLYVSYHRLVYQMTIIKLSNERLFDIYNNGYVNYFYPLFIHYLYPAYEPAINIFSFKKQGRKIISHSGLCRLSSISSL